MGGGRRRANGEWQMEKGKWRRANGCFLKRCTGELGKVMGHLGLKVC